MFFELTKIDWNSLSAIMSFLAFIILIGTLVEMRISRYLSVKPSLVFIMDGVFFQNDSYGRPIIFKQSIDIENEFNYAFFYVPIENTGIGIAKDIKIKWKINTNKFQKDIDRFLNTNDTGFKKNVSEDGIHYNYANFGFFLQKKIDESFQIVKINDKVIASVPTQLMAYIAFYLTELCKMSKIETNIFDGILPVTIYLSYKNIENKLLKEKYKIEYHLYVDKRKINCPNENAIFGKIRFSTK